MKNNNYKHLLIFAISSIIGIGAHAQASTLQVNSASTDARAIVAPGSAVLPGPTDGFVVPRVNRFPATAPAATANGMMLYLQASYTTNAAPPPGATANSVYPIGYYYWTGGTGSPASTWLPLATAVAAPGSTSWKTTGNIGTVAGTNFIGTTDANDMVVKTNNTEKMRVASGGSVGIGTTAPNTSAILDLSSTSKGLLLPRVALTGTTDVTTIPNPAKGMQVFATQTNNDIDSSFIYWYDGYKWVRPITNITVGTTPPVSITWGASTANNEPLNNVQIYVLGPFTVPVSGWYSFRNRIYFGSSGAAGNMVICSINKDDTSPSTDSGSIWDARFTLADSGTAFVNPPAPGFLYILKSSNYYIKFTPFVFSGTTSVSAEKQIILTLFK